MTPNNANAITIQLRYCFEDENLHSMNAEIFNECERHFIKAIKSTEKYLEDTLSIEIKPREKGSLVDVLTVTLNNPATSIIAGGAVALITIFATKFLESKYPSAKHKTDEIASKLQNLQEIREHVKNGTLTQEGFDYIAGSDKELRKLKSNFFRTAKKDHKITSLEMKTMPSTALQPIITVVYRKDFEAFILPDTLEIIDDTQQVKIFIVAPILIKGRKDSWKGICEGSGFEFKITDDEFLTQVWNQLIKFSNGTFINCELKTTKTTNIETDETKISREVTNVINYGDDDKQVVKITRKKKKEVGIVQQPTLFDIIPRNK